MMKNKIYNKTDRWVKRLLPFILLVFLPLSASAVTKAEADSAYAQEHYQKAVQDYEQLLKKGVSADLYYNLGNRICFLTFPYISHKMFQIVFHIFL